MSLYFSPFFTSFILSIVGIALFLFIWKKYGVKESDRQELGRNGKRNISRWGGAIVGIVFLLVLFLDPSLKITSDVWGLILGCAGMLFLGMMDDMRSLSWRWQLLFQGTVIAVVVYFFGVHISNIPNLFGGRIFFDGEWGMVLGSVLAGMWFLLVVNAINWSDGVDGVAPGIVVLAALALFAVSLRPEVYQPPVAIIALVLAGSYLGLFLFNWYPARIFSGTAGVFVAGFAIAYLSIFAGMKIATAFLVLGIPILDALWVIWKRFQLGESLAHPDKKHLHYWFLTLGWNERKVSFFLLGIVFILTSSTFVFEKGGKFFSIIVLFLFFVIFVHKRKNFS